MTWTRVEGNIASTRGRGNAQEKKKAKRGTKKVVTVETVKEATAEGDAYVAGLLGAPVVDACRAGVRVSGGAAPREAAQPRRTTLPRRASRTTLPRRASRASCFDARRGRGPRRASRDGASFSTSSRA